MPLIVLLKRFEVWLLLGVVVGILFFALAPEESAEDGVAGTDVDPGTEIEPAPEPVVLTQVLPDPVANPQEVEEAPPALVVEEVLAEPTEGGKIISMKLLARSLDGEKIVLDQQSLQVSTNTGEHVPRFFAPFQEEPVIETDTPTEVEVKFWLATGEQESSAKTLWLDFQGEKTEAKIPGNG